jgi:hypothetical protein
MPWYLVSGYCQKVSSVGLTTGGHRAFFIDAKNGDEGNGKAMKRLQTENPSQSGWCNYDVHLTEINKGALIEMSKTARTATQINADHKE